MRAIGGEHNGVTIGFSLCNCIGSNHAGRSRTIFDNDTLA
jgi:hypothetical protein